MTLWDSLDAETQSRVLSIFNCGCGGRKVYEEEMERVVREIEEERGPAVEPVPGHSDNPIPVDLPVRKPTEVETVRS